MSKPKPKPPWISGFCNVNNPLDSHGRCPGSRSDGVLCGCRHPRCPHNPERETTMPEATPDWADVDVNQYGQITCPVMDCGADMYLIRTHCIPLVAEDGVNVGPECAVSATWEVECTNGHKLINSGAGSGEDVPPYDHRRTHEILSALRGAS